MKLGRFSDGGDGVEAAVKGAVEPVSAGPPAGAVVPGLLLRCHPRMPLFGHNLMYTAKV